MLAAPMLLMRMTALRGSIGGADWLCPPGQVPHLTPERQASNENKIECNFQEMAGMIPGKPILLLVHSEPWVRRELAEEIRIWSSSSLDVLAVASESEAYAAISAKPGAQDLLAIVIADEKLIDDDGEQFLKGIHRNFPGAALALLTTRSEGATDDGIERLYPSRIPLRAAIKPLYTTWSPPNPRVVIKGPTNTTLADELTSVLYLTSTGFEWSDETGKDISITVDGTHLRNATPEGLFRALQVFRTPERSRTYPYDLVIVGSGPAGLSAAINAGVNVGFRTLVMESRTPGGVAATSINPIDNYLGFPDGISGIRLTALAIEQLQKLDLVDFAPALRACWLKHDRERYGRYILGAIDSETGDLVDVSAGMVLLACGQTPHRLKLKLPERGVYYAALPCDQQREINRDVIVVGGGNSAGQAAMQFSATSRSVSMIAAIGFDRMSQPLMHKIEEEQAAGRIKVFHGYRVEKFIGNSQLEMVRIKNGEAIEKLRASSAYILIGGKPDTGWLHPDISAQRLGAELVQLNRYGCIKTDYYVRPHRGKLGFETSQPGVFAAGDVRVNALRRVGQAAGQGAAAVASMEVYAAENPRILVDETSPAYRRFAALRLTSP